MKTKTHPLFQKKIVKKSFLWSIILCIISVCISGINSCEYKKSVQQYGALTHQGHIRTFSCYVPASYDGSTAVPLILGLPRFAETGFHLAAQSGLNEMAEIEGFIVVYADGHLLRFDAYDDGESQDDIGFLLRIVKEAKRRFHIDPERVYVVGASNGGFMAHRLLMEASDVFAAGASVAATVIQKVAEEGQPARPVSIMMLNGTEDFLTPYEGGKQWDIWRMIDMLSVRDVARLWAYWNGCDLQPVTRLLPESFSEEGLSIFEERYLHGHENTEVCLLTIEGGGHTWPGGSEYLPGFVSGPSAEHFSATRAIWSFFKRHRRSPL